MSTKSALHVAALALAAATALPSGIAAQTIVDQWSTVAVPTPPPLKAVTVDPKTTALLMLDFMRQNCGARPRCVASIPAMKRLVTAARAAGTPIVYSIIANSTTADILPDVAIGANEPYVQAAADKFAGTTLQKTLADRGVKTVIVVGTAANGAVLNTATRAALLGYNVVVPVDGMSAENPYAEQFTAWQLANGPGLGPKTTLTRSDLVTFAR